MDQESISQCASSSISKNDETKSLEDNDNENESIESRKGKRHMEKNEDKNVDSARKISKKDDLELQIGFGGFPIDALSRQESGSSSRQIYKKPREVELRLGTSVVPMIPPPQLVNIYDLNADADPLLDALGRDPSIICLARCPRYYYASIASINRSFRQLIKSGELFKKRSNDKLVEHWVYFSCNVKLNWEAFDPICNKWMRLPEGNANEFFERLDKESMAVGTQLLVLGNGLEGQIIYKYNLLTNSWSLGHLMNTPRCLFGSASLGNIAIFAGGVDRKGKILDVVERYNSETEAWETLPSLLKPRKMASGVFMDNKFYLIGGIGLDMKPLKCGEVYDKGWTEIPNMWPIGGGNSAAPPLLAVVNNELYAADPTMMELNRYSKSNNKWDTIGRLPESTHNINGWGMAFRGCGERVIVIGGPRATNDTHVAIYSWIPSEGPPQWTMIGWKKSDKFVYNCAIMGC
ncbi:Galactose oxidase, beta-propeller [Artemisia annua]|uniref:Galactose oxidase, beta-propeller n=1 Tax=Artemisia annua TaxID=35608 RepID=A0A2U1M974_ARTAN|nr:Galactose oxidase, beta-propeller [Artemisia annua]